MVLDAPFPEQSAWAQAEHRGMFEVAEFWRALRDLDSDLRGQIEAEVREKSLRTLRASHIHDHWVRLAMRPMAPIIDDPAHFRDILQRGSARPPQTWLENRALNQFPLGPVHLDRADAEESPAHFVLLAMPLLLALLDDLGLAGLVIATSDAPPRRQAAIALSLDEFERHIYSMMRVQLSPQLCVQMKPRMQSVLIGSGSRGVDHALVGMGADLMALALSRRYALELRFMTRKLPPSRGEVLVRAMSSVLRNRKLWGWAEDVLREVLKIRALARE